MRDDDAEIIDLPSGGMLTVPALEAARGRQPTRDVVPPPSTTTTGPLIVCESLVKIYKVADLEVVALQGLDLVVEQGEFIALVGASGSGKSTLMSILGGLDEPSAGRAVVAGHLLSQMGPQERTRYRRSVVGFVWQQTARNLLPYLTSRENIELPMLLEGVGRREQKTRADELLALVGLADRANHRPDQLSGGQQQRVAIAVALANRPSLLLADEPTGELDTATAGEVFGLLRAVNHDLGVTIVVVTHDPLVSEQVSRTVAMRDGRTSTETLRRRSVTDEGDHHVIAEEYAVLDRVGRLQLPRAHVEALGLEHRVRLALEEDHIGVWPDRDGGDRDGPGPGAEEPS
jgi:ABC-type lipoprotein export system ATPase subunit